VTWIKQKRRLDLDCGQVVLCEMKTCQQAPTAQFPQHWVPCEEFVPVNENNIGYHCGRYDFRRRSMTAELALTRIQEKGQVTLPADLRRRLGLKKGDLVAVTETVDGILITPQEVVATRALAEIGAALAEQGLTLDEMIDRGRAIREDLVREQYDLADNPTSS